MLLAISWVDHKIVGVGPFDNKDDLIWRLALDNIDEGEYMIVKVEAKEID